MRQLILQRMPISAGILYIDIYVAIVMLRNAITVEV